MERYKLVFETENEKQSEKIQLRLFELGYAWYEGKKVGYCEKAYIYTFPDGQLNYGDSSDLFYVRIKDNAFQLCTLEELNDLICSNHEWVEVEACGVVNQYCRKCKIMKEE